jgi:hypothetical protein
MSSTAAKDSPLPFVFNVELFASPSPQRPTFRASHDSLQCRFAVVRNDLPAVAKLDVDAMNVPGRALIAARGVLSAGFDAGGRGL